MVSWLYDSENGQVILDLFAVNQNWDKIRLDKQRQDQKNEKAEDGEEPVNWHTDEIFSRGFFR